MSRLKFLGALALVTAMSALHARAAAPTLPPDVIAADTVFVVHLDAAHFNPDQIQAAATAILGANANKVAEPLKKFKERFDKAAAAGAEAITIVGAPPAKKADGAAAAADVETKKDNGNGVMYIQLKADADVKAIEAMITADMKAEDKEKTVFDQADNFLAVHEKTQAFPVKPDAARAALFADALATVADASIQIAFIPDQATRDEMLKGADNAPAGFKDAAPIIAKAKWTTLAINVGNAPSLTVTVNAAAEADAKTLSDNITSGLADLKAKANNPGPDAGIMALAGPIVGPLIDGLKPATNGTQVSISIKTDAMKTIANFAATLGLLGTGGAPPQ